MMTVTPMAKVPDFYSSSPRPQVAAPRSGIFQALYLQVLLAVFWLLHNPLTFLPGNERPLVLLVWRSSVHLSNELQPIKEGFRG